MGQLQPQYNEDIEVCPNCGDLVDVLNDTTGWCDSCSGVTPSNSCIRCGQEIGSGIRCSRCKYLFWLDCNADQIERLMATDGIKASKAKRLVIEQNRPKCLSCGEPIHRGMKDRDLFCNTKPECRRAGNAYDYHKNRQRRPHNESVQRALVAAEIVRLTIATLKNPPL